MIAATVLVAGIGLAFNWSWLVAAGFASIIIAVLPCVAMCGLGLCMAKGGAGRAPTPRIPMPPRCETQHRPLGWKSMPIPV